MSTERRHPDTAELDAWPLARSLEALVAGHEGGVAAVRRALPDLTRAAEGIEPRLARGGRLGYAGAGTSGRLAVLDAAELAPTFGFDRTVVLLAGGAAAIRRSMEGAEDDEDAARGEVDEAGLGEADVLIGVAASGATPYTRAAMRRARELGAFTVGLANAPGAPLLREAEVGVLLDSGPEVLAGSTRMAAGTAQKAALNALSTAVLVRLGGAYGNLMVGMRPLNAKLRRRAVTIVREATGVDDEAAAAALAVCDQRIRDAIVTLLADVEPAEARRRLAAAGERVRDAIAGGATTE
ncbi:MAG: N-acetylmuramic acid 6-phosphate etherase [Trueperaceae bacterium]|nr:N-acetylmuramic acid 6-phosphate etherase [Trueperaceae bacterium]